MKNIDLKQYLKKILDLEISLYQQNLVYEHVENQITQLENRINSSPQFDGKYKITNVSQKVIFALKYFVLPGFVIGMAFGLICNVLRLMSTSISTNIIIFNMIGGGIVGAYISFSVGMLFYGTDDVDGLAEGAVLSFWGCIVVPIHTFAIGRYIEFYT